MKFPRFIAVMLLLCNTGYSQLVTGVEPIINNQAYVVHSELRIDTTLFNTSNMYILNGTSDGTYDSVFIFGMGYGEPKDLRIYRDCTLLNTSLQQDIHLVDSVIQLFGLTRPLIQFIVPHQHLDHVNQEFVYGMDSVFGTLQSFIYVHENDYGGSVCNLHCCSGLTCVQGDPFFGIPFWLSWDTPTLLKFKIIGAKNDLCNYPCMFFQTSYGGWTVLHADTFHTKGGLNITNDSLNIKILGAEQGSGCFTPFGWDILPPHGNANVDSVYTLIPPIEKKPIKEKKGKKKKRVVKKIVGRKND